MAESRLPRLSFVFDNNDQHTYRGETKLVPHDDASQGCNVERRVRHGEGVMTFASGDVYQGEWAMDAMQGSGVLSFANGAEFRGSFEGGTFKEGVLRLPDRTCLKGAFCENQPHGLVEMTNPDGILFIGEFDKGSCADLRRVYTTE